MLTQQDSGKLGENSASASPQVARAIAKEAYIYAFPLAANYQTLYKQAIDTTSHDYRAPFNTLTNASSVATPEDKFVVTPNSDTPYSYLWMDLRAEPLVVTMPSIEKDRYYTGQLIDLYTFNFAYLGTRSFGNDGGNFLVAGPGWNGATPAGIKAVLRAQTQFAYLLIRTQLFNAADIVNVRTIQGWLWRSVAQRLSAPTCSAFCPGRQLAEAERGYADHGGHFSLFELPAPVLPHGPLRDRSHGALRRTQPGRGQELRTGQFCATGPAGHR